MMTLSNSTSLYFLWTAISVALDSQLYIFALSGICFGTPMIIIRQMEVWKAKKPDVVEYEID